MSEERGIYRVSGQFDPMAEEWDDLIARSAAAVMERVRSSLGDNPTDQEIHQGLADMIAGISDTSGLKAAFKASLLEYMRAHYHQLK